jgi:hypothetical protein
MVRGPTSAEWRGARSWATAERPSVLLDLATACLIEAKLLFWLAARAVGVAFLR